MEGAVLLGIFGLVFAGLISIVYAGLTMIVGWPVPSPTVVQGIFMICGGGGAIAGLIFSAM